MFQSSASRSPWAMPLVLAALAITFVFPAQVRAENKKSDDAPHIRIGMVASLFHDSPMGLAKPVVAVFATMVRGQTGFDSEIVPGNEPQRLGERIATNDVQFGIFQGVEFAWAKKKYPKLMPLLIIVNDRPKRHAALVVRDSSTIKSFADLKGKKVAVPLHSRLHCELFLQHGCGACKPADFCAKLVRPATGEEALDDLVDGTHDALVLDVVALESYGRRKPGRFAKLKVVKQSEAFPPSVVAYRPGRLGAKQLQQFKDGLLRSQETVFGRQLMQLWRMSAFAPVPADLDKQLDEIIKVYPPPKKD